MTDLHLPLKAEYFDQITNGTKPEEYRLVTDYWKKRLEGRQFNTIIIKKGYPKKGDTTRISRRKWKGYTTKTITHPHFGTKPVQVFAIDVSEAY